MKDTKKVNILRVKGEETSKEDDIVIIEYPFTIFVNDEEIVTLLCSPDSLEELTVGFLNSEGFVSSPSDIEKIRVDDIKGIGYVYIKNINEFNERLRGKRTITSGCGKGTLFYNVMDSFKSKKIEEAPLVKIEDIKELMRLFNKKSELFHNTGGVHSCAMSDNCDTIIFKEDIGRHNALDKVLGRAFLDKIPTNDKIILTSGRISSEILIKTSKRQIPVIVSRSAPTSLAVEMAEELGITLIGFARGEKLNIYTNFPSIIF